MALGRFNVVEMRGFSLHVRRNRQIEDMDVMDEVIRRDMYRLERMAKIMPTPAVILDVGGHIGTFGLLAKRYWPSARLIALEPNETSAELYEMNMSSNGVTDVRVVRAAVCYEGGEMCLVEPAGATGSGFLRPTDDAKQLLITGVRGVLVGRMLHRPKDLSLGRMSVDTVTLEDLLRQYQVDTFDLVKWDCEGGEISAIRGMTDDTAERLRYQLGEYHIPGPCHEHLSGTRKEYLEFCSLVEERFQPQALLTSHTYPLGRFWVFPRV